MKLPGLQSVLVPLVLALGTTKQNLNCAMGIDSQHEPRGGLFQHKAHSYLHLLEMLTGLLQCLNT